MDAGKNQIAFDCIFWYLDDGVLVASSRQASMMREYHDKIIHLTLYCSMISVFPDILLRSLTWL
jgi:hypothetical protein